MAQLLFVFSRRGAVCCCFALFSFVVFLFPCCLGPFVCSASRRPCDSSSRLVCVRSLRLCTLASEEVQYVDSRVRSLPRMGLESRESALFFAFF